MMVKARAEVQGVNEDGKTVSGGYEGFEGQTMHQRYKDW
jgi:hypothetical protein